MSRRANGDGSLYYDEKRKLWRGTVMTGYDANGKRKRKSVSGKTQTEVKQKMKQIEMNVFTGAFVDESQITIEQLTRQILDEKLAFNDFNQVTYFRYLETLKMLAPISATPLQRATETQLRSFLVSLIEHPYSQSALNKAFQLLRQTFKEAVKRDIIRRDPMNEIRQPKTKKQTVKVRALTETEQQRLVEALTGNEIRYANQMLISMLTGMRMGEVNALTVGDVDFTRNMIHVHATISKGMTGDAILKQTTKTYAGTRDIPMTEEVRAILADCVRFVQIGNVPSVGQLFHNGAGNLVPTVTVNDLFKKVLKDFQILDVFPPPGKVTLHSLRHTYATRCIEGGMPPNVLQKLLGHADISITMNTYADVLDRFRDREIAKVNAYLKANGLTIDTGKYTAKNQVDVM